MRRFLVPIAAVAIAAAIMFVMSRTSSSRPLAAIAGACTLDEDCSEGLECAFDRRGTDRGVCVKACGPSPLESDEPTDEPTIRAGSGAEWSCPAGYTCGASMRTVQIDEAGHEVGAAFGGFLDHAICVKTKL